MKVRIVPSTRDGRRQLLTSYLINGTLAVDAGALAIGLSRAEQLRVRAIIITHTHLDHVISLPLLVTDLFEDLREPIRLFATPSDFDALRAHIFNPRMWVTLETLRNERTALLDYHPMRAGETFVSEGMRVTPVPVTHAVQTHGLLVEDGQGAALFTSDTGATERAWELTRECAGLRAVFIDLSYPAALTRLARAAGHHSTETLAAELDKVRPGVTVYGVHLKPNYRERIIEEVAALGDPRLRIAEVGREYEF